MAFLSITYKVFGDFSGSKELYKHMTSIFNKCKQMWTQTAFLTIQHLMKEAYQDDVPA